MTLFADMSADLTGRNAQSRKVGNNTYKQRRGEHAVAIKLHDTDVVTVHDDGRIVLNTGGWKTVTTKARINAWLPNYCGLYSDRGVWYLSIDQTRYAFAEGITLTPCEDGGWAVLAGTDGPKDAALKDAKFKKRIREYATYCSSKLPLPMPSGGDCWYCAMFEKAPGPGKLPPNVSTDHLLEHMKTRYVVPSLVWNALIYSGAHPDRLAGNWWFQVAFAPRQNPHDYENKEIARFVYRYLCRCFGLAV